MAKSLANNTVLFVDDEESILNALRRELIDEEYRCLFALSGGQALKLMPEMDGLTLLKVVKEKYPSTVRVVLSGYTQLPQILVTINQAEVFKFLTKPWGSELKSVIREAIAYHRLLEDKVKIEQLLSLQYDESIGINKKNDDLTPAAGNSHILFAAMGMKALEMAADVLDSPEKYAMAKEQLAMASSLLHDLSGMDFEECGSITVKDLYEDISRTLLKGNVKRVEVDTEAYSKTIRTRHKVLSGFVTTAVRNLTEYPHDYSVKIKPRTNEARHEATLFISALENQDVPEDGYKGQRAYVDMLNSFASKVLSLMDGEFLGLITKGVVILKIVVYDCGQ
jgi:YesN/AraC family two-component response regulator